MIKLQNIKFDLGVDTISKRGDVITVRKGYFYTMGKSAQNVIDIIEKKFGEAVTIVNSGNHHANFRGGASVAQSSHWWVKFSIAQEKEIDN